MSTISIGRTGGARGRVDFSSGRPAAGSSKQPRLRLTRRGRSVITTLVALPLVIAAFGFALNGGGAIATLDDPGVQFEYVTVDPGQSLWTIAEDIAPAADPRDVIAAVMRLNQLESSDLFAGQELAIPSQYASR